MPLTNCRLAPSSLLLGIVCSMPFSGDARAKTDVGSLRETIAHQAALIADLQARVAALEAPRERSPTPDAAPPALLNKPSDENDAAVHSRITTPGLAALDWSSGGPRFVLDDGTSFHVRGRLYVDGSSTSGSRFDTRNISGTELSSARLGVDGTIGHHWGYKAEVEFADGAISLKETYIAYLATLADRQLQVFVGNKTGDRTIDGASYDDLVPFFQRSMLATSIGPEKGIMGVGVLVKLAGPDWHLGIDVSGDNPNGNVGTSSDTVSMIGRATWTPRIATGTRLHLGAWGYYEAIAKGSILQLTRSVYPGEHFNDTLLIKMVPIADPRSSSGEGGEIGIVHGPFWAFGEYGRRRIVATAESRIWTAWVAEAGLFLTGEPANFSQSFGAWTAVTPHRSLFEGGRGAVELVTRFERSDLGPETLAGSGEDSTLGVSWYLASNVRILLDWVHWRVAEPIAPYVGIDSGNTFNLRFDTSF